MSNAAPAATVVAGCRLGSVRFAVATTDVLQLLSYPSSLITLPRREGALRGAFMLRDVAVPIVDLRRWLPWPDPVAAEAPAQLMVLRQGTRWLAIGIDGVEDLHRVSADAVQRLDHGDAGDDVFSGVVHLAHAAVDSAGAGGALGLLDVTALMRLSKVWTEALDGEARFGHGTSAGASASGPAASTLTACALVDCEGRLLAIPAAHLRSVVPMPALQPLWHGDPNRPGVAHWRGRDVPVLRLLSMLGIGMTAAAATAAPLLAVLEHEGLCTGIPVQAVRDVQMLDLAAVQPIEALGAAPSPVLPGLLLRPGGERALLVDVPTLVTTDPLAALSTSTNTRVAALAGGVQAHVVVKAGIAWALPISALLEIIELPEAWTSGAPPETPCGHTWRQHAVPLWDLRAMKGHGVTSASADAKVLILNSGARPIGLVVEALLHLLPAHTAELHQIRTPDGRVLPFVVHRHGEQQRSFALLGPQEWPQGPAH